MSEKKTYIVAEESFTWRGNTSAPQMVTDETTGVNINYDSLTAKEKILLGRLARIIELLERLVERP